jgi:acylphosphatase
VSHRVRAEIVVRGRVQGVFFRASAQQEALRLGLTGEVRNLPDGSVEAIVEGEKSAVDDFVAWCRRGPPSADVEDVQVKLLPPRDEFRTFTVTR